MLTTMFKHRKSKGRDRSLDSVPRDSEQSRIDTLEGTTEELKVMFQSYNEMNMTRKKIIIQNGYHLY